MLYTFVKNWARIFFPFFFNKFKVIGRENIPKEGAVIFAPNHQGAFMDAVILGSFTDKPVSFLTRADIFKKSALPYLNALNMMPIYRIRDGYETLSQNEEVFQKCYDLLAENKKRLMIFPEGNHSAEFYLRPLSKGASRIAFGAREAIPRDKKLWIVPTGINYFSHRYPAKVIMNFGKAIDIDQYMDTYIENNQKGFQDLKKDLEERMKEVLILPEKTEDYEERKRFVFQKKHEKLSFDEIKKLAAGKIGKVRPPSKNIFKKPLIAFFSIINLPVYFLMRKILNKMKDKAFYISMKFYTGFVLIFIWWLILFTIGALTIGWKFGLFLLVTSLLFLYARKALIGYSN